MQIIELPDDVPVLSHAIGKMAMYDMFLKEEDAKFLVVVGEGGTGKSIALKLVCDGVKQHPQIEMVYDDIDSVIIPAKDSDAPTKYIAHSWSYGEKERSMFEQSDAWVIKFENQFPPPKDKPTQHIPVDTESS
jgi:ABC-type antimicrobial peptide transport system ATPase subunit